MVLVPCVAAYGFEIWNLVCGVLRIKGRKEIKNSNIGVFFFFFSFLGCLEQLGLVLGGLLGSREGLT